VHRGPPCRNVPVTFTLDRMKESAKIHREPDGTLSFESISSLRRCQVVLLPLLVSAPAAGLACYLLGARVASAWGIDPAAALLEQKGGLTFVSFFLAAFVVLLAACWVLGAAVIVRMLLPPEESSWRRAWVAVVSGRFPKNWEAR
jgi:hypothetical protein